MSAFGFVGFILFFPAVSCMFILPVCFMFLSRLDEAQLFSLWASSSEHVLIRSVFQEPKNWPSRNANKNTQRPSFIDKSLSTFYSSSFSKKSDTPSPLPTMWRSVSVCKSTWILTSHPIPTPTGCQWYPNMIGILKKLHLEPLLPQRSVAILVLP